MHIDANRGGHLSNAPTPRPTACYNLISAGAPFLGFLAALMFLMIVGFDRPDVRGGMEKLETAIWILGGSFFVGFVLAIIALVRLERLWGLTVFGLILNALPFLAWLGLNWR